MMFADKRQPAFASPNMHVTGTAVHDGRYIDALEELLDINKLHMHSIFHFHSLLFKETEVQ